MQMLPTPIDCMGVDVSAAKSRAGKVFDQPPGRSTTTAPEIENRVHATQGLARIVERSLDSLGDSLTLNKKEAYIKAFGNLVPEKRRRHSSVPRARDYFDCTVYSRTDIEKCTKSRIIYSLCSGIGLA